MKFNDANDVTKALAAFGAPSIRYHSFGPGKVRPSSKVVQRPDPQPPQQIPRQDAPDVTPEPPLAAAPLPPPPPPPPAERPAALPGFRRTVDPASFAPHAAPVMPKPLPRVVNDQLFRSFNTVTSLTPSPAPVITHSASLRPIAPDPAQTAPVAVARAPFPEPPRGRRSLADIFALLASAPGARRQ